MTRKRLEAMSRDQLIRVASTALAARAELADRAGISFGSRRDTYKTFGYPRTIPFARFRAEYRRDGLARRIVRLPASATWRGGIEILESTDPGNETAFERDCRLLIERTKMVRYFRRLDELAGLGRYAVMVLGLPGKPEDPVEKASLDDLKYLSVYSEESAEVVDIDWSEESGRYGKPLLYQISLADPALRRMGRKGSENPKVHWTRVIHVARNLLEDDVFGRSDLECVFNRLIDAEKEIGASAEALWKNADRGIVWNLDKDAKVTPELLAYMDQQIDEVEHDQRKNVKTKGVKPFVLQGQAVDPRGAFEATISVICAGTGIPQRIFLGSERGELASMQDKLNWGEVTDDRRENFAEPDMVRAVFDRMIEFGALAAPADGYTVDFAPAVQLSEDELASVALKRSQAVLNIANARAKKSPLSLQEIRESIFNVDPEPPPELLEEEEAAAEKAADIGGGQNGFGGAQPEGAVPLFNRRRYGAKRRLRAPRRSATSAAAQPEAGAA